MIGRLPRRIGAGTSLRKRPERRRPDQASSTGAPGPFLMMDSIALRALALLE